MIAPGQSPCSFVADCFPATVCSTACRKSALGSLANTARACVFPPRAYFAFHHRRAGGRECNLQRGRRARAPHADHCRGGSGGIEKEGVILERSLLTRGRRVFAPGIIASPACCGRIRVGRRHSLAVSRRVALYRSKRISPVEVVTATLDRIDRLDRLYNAFVMIDREGALRDARASEERWRQHRLARQARLSYLPCASSPSILAVVFLISTTSNRVSSEPKSPLPGNGIFRAETKRPKQPRRFKDAVAGTKSR